MRWPPFESLRRPSNLWRHLHAIPASARLPRHLHVYPGILRAAIEGLGSVLTVDTSTTTGRAAMRLSTASGRPGPVARAVANGVEAVPGAKLAGQCGVPGAGGGGHAPAGTGPSASGRVCAYRRRRSAHTKGGRCVPHLLIRPFVFSERRRALRRRRVASCRR